MWTYHDYEEQETDALRLARLRRHITEVNAKVSADVSAGAYSRSSHPLTTYLAQLHDRRKELEGQANSELMANAGVSFARRNRVQ